MSEYKPKRGDYGVVKTTGWIGFLIRLATMSRWNHTFIYLGAGMIVEANPRGVEVSPASKYPQIAWNRHEDLTPEQRKKIVSHAHLLVGQRYSFSTIALLVLRIIGVKTLATKLLEKLAKKDGYICSELVAECYTKAGVNLFKKEDYLVVPGDLAERLIYQ